MLTALKKLGTARVVPKSGPFPFTRQALPLYALPKKSFAFKQEPDVVEAEEGKPSLDFNEEVQRLLTDKVNDIINPERLKNDVEELLLETHKTPAQRQQDQLKKLEEYAGPNYKRIVNTEYKLSIDAYKDRTLQRAFAFNFQNSLDNYKFKDGFDYHVLDKNDEAKALARLNVVELGNSFVQSQLKYVLKEDEHFSKYEGEYYAEDYLKGKPANYVAVFNLPAHSTLTDLHRLFAKYGEIKNINLRRTLFGFPAILEVVYNTREQAQAARSAQNQKRYQGNVLSVRTVEDSEYEDPVNRTVVVCGLDPQLSVQALLEHLGNFGSVMHFELPVQQEIRARPTREELQEFARDRSVNDNGRYKINIKTSRYEMKNGKLTHSVASEKNILEANDNRPLFYEEQLANKEMDEIDVDIEEQERKEQEYYAKKFFTDPYEKTLEAADLSQFKINHTTATTTKNILERKDEPSLQYYMQSVEDIKSRTSNNSTLTYDQKVDLHNALEKPYSHNMGYIFATFSNTDEAKKAMINIPLYPLFGNAKVTLKKDDSHIDWDAQFFTETYEKIRDNNAASADKIMDKQQELKDKQEVYATIEDFKEKTFGDEYEKHIFDNPVKKREIQVKRSPEEWMQYMREEEEENRIKVQEELESIYEARASAQFSKKDVFEKKVDSDEEDYSYQAGRAFTNNVTDRQVANFEKVLKNQKIRRQQQLNVDGKNIQQRAVEELFSKTLGGEDVGSESMLLDRFRQHLDSHDPIEIFSKDLEHHDEVEETIANQAAKDDIAKLFRQRQPANMIDMEGEEKKEGEEEEDEDMYYNPFQPINDRRPAKIEAPTASEDIETKAKYLEKHNKYLQKVHKYLNGTYTKGELQEEIEKNREELKDGVKVRPHFMETDKDGNPYITKEDEARLEEEEKPEDPAERAEYEKIVERMGQLEQMSWYREVAKMADSAGPVIEKMMSKGFPIEAYKFNPTEDCESIDEFIDKMKAANPKYNFEKSIDEDGNDVVVKLVRDNTFSSEINIGSEEEMEKFIADLQGYLVENGVPEEEVRMTEFQGTEEEYMQEMRERNNFNMSAMDEKVLELLLNKFSKGTVEEILTGSALAPENIDATLLKLQQQAALKERQDRERGLTKDDFVKYSSQVFNVRENNGKFKKSKYDII